MNAARTRLRPWSARLRVGNPKAPHRPLILGELQGLSEYLSESKVRRRVS